MIIYVLMTFLVVVAVGFGVLVRCVTRAPYGYEDENGFHPGFRPGELPGAVAYVGPERRHPSEMAAGARSASPRRRISDYATSQMGVSRAEGVA